MRQGPTLKDWIGRRGPELRLALRTALAGLLTFAIAHLLQLPQGYWAVLTSVIVMQLSLGGSLKAGLDRLAATIAGAIWGVLVTFAIPHRDVYALVAALALALGPLAVVASLRPAYRVAPVTAIIVLLSTTGSQSGPLAYAVDRVLEIGLGCLVGLVVSLWILPARAHGLLSDAAANVVHELAQILSAIMEDPRRPADPEALIALHARARRAIAEVEALVEEAKRERFHRLTDAPDPEPVARNLRRIRHDLVTIGRALASPLPAPGQHHLLAPLADMRRAVGEFLAGAAAAFAGRAPAPSRAPAESALAAFDRALAALRQSGELRQLDADSVAQIYGLSFALHQLDRNLADLADRAGEAGKADTA